MTSLQGAVRAPSQKMGQVILKDKFLSHCASDIRIKLQLQHHDPASSLNEAVQTATNTFYNREQEKEVNAQEREKRKKTRHAQMLAALQGSPMASPKSLKDKAWGKCLICRQVGYWANECPNHDKSPKKACYKCHQLGHWVALCPQDPRASRASTKPSLTMVQQDRSSPLQPAHLSQITITGPEPRVQLYVAGRPQNFLVDTGDPTVFWPPTPEPSPPKPVPFSVTQEKKLQKDSPEHFVAGMYKYFPTSF